MGLKISGSSSGGIVRMGGSVGGDVTGTLPSGTVVEAVNGLPPSFKSAVRVATTGAGTLATSFEAGDTIDGEVLATGDRILIKNQASALQNGIYVVSTTGLPVRAPDMDEADEVPGAIVYVIDGTTNGGTLWVNTNTTEPVLETDAITFIAFSGGGSAIQVFNEGSSLTAALASLDFVGAGVTATTTGDAVTVTIPSTGIQLASITAASSAIAATEAVVVSASLAAGSITAGNSYRITGAGVGTTGVTPGTDTFRIRIGTTTLTGTIPTSTTALGVAAVTGQSFSFVAIITVRTGGGSGTVIGECVAFSANVATGRYATLNNLSATTATVAVDTTVTNLLELTFQSGNAGSSNIFHVASIEQLTVAAVAGPTTVRGVVNPDGTIASGTGFTAVRNGAGDYTVTFTTAFPAAPVVVVSMYKAAVGFTAGVKTQVVGTLTTTAFSVNVGEVGVALVDMGFTFIAMAV